MSRDAVGLDWLKPLREELWGFVSELRLDGQPGRYLPCRDGAVRAGREAGLGFSCFAKKILDATGGWEGLDESERLAWMGYIRSFQVDSGAVMSLGEGLDGMFVDPGLLAALPETRNTWRERLRRYQRGWSALPPREDAMLAETKQAIATLAWSGVSPRRPFGGFPCRQKALLARLRSLDWSRPWSAGAKSAWLAVFIQTQGALLAGVEAPALRESMIGFLKGLLDPETGGYFRAAGVPPRGQLINGAMKVLNALEWLDEPIHQPERLIDTCLLQGPPPAGCHVVDWVYVVHRCLRQTDHRRGEIRARLLEVLALIRTHRTSDRGFAYMPGRAQTGYYGALISRGLDEGDLHGTCLLTWAIAMIVETAELDLPGWKTFRA
ncbi:MAG: hypothetical protein HQL98_16040 [Magnetococcales bacterium]|nr:hypothetical protein [Magnetococcales bacterium]